MRTIRDPPHYLAVAFPGAQTVPADLVMYLRSQNKQRALFRTIIASIHRYYFLI